jgi:hypothetical protein
MKSFEEFERSLKVEEKPKDLSKEKEIKEKFQRDLLDMFDRSELCELGHLSRNRYLSHFIKFLRKQDLIKKDSEQNLERKLLQNNSGHSFWDQYEDVFMRGGLVSLYHDDELEKAKNNLRMIMSGLNGEFVAKVLHDETEKGLRGSKVKTSPLMIKIRKKLKTFCYEERKDRELGKLNYLNTIAYSIAEKLNNIDNLNDYNMSNQAKLILKGLKDNQLILGEDCDVLQKVIQDINDDDIKDKQRSKTKKKKANIKDAFLAFLNSQEMKDQKERKLVISKSNKFDKKVFLQRMEEKLEKSLTIESNLSIIKEFKKFVHKSRHSSANSIRKKLTTFFKELTALGKVARRQELQIKNLTRSVLLDSFLVRPFDIDSFFHILESRVKDKNKKHVVEGIFLHFLKNSMNSSQLKKMLSDMPSFSENVGNKFDQLAKSLDKQELVSKTDLRLMKPRVLYDFQLNLNSDVGLDRELSNFRELRLVSTSALTTAKIATSPRLLKKCRRIIGKSRHHGMSIKTGFILLIAKRFMKEYSSQSFSTFISLKLTISEFLEKLKQENLIRESEVEPMADQLKSLLIKFYSGGKLDMESFEAHFKGYHEEQSLNNLRFRIGNIILSTEEGGMTENEILSTKEKLRKYELKYKFNLEDLIVQYKEELPQEEDTEALYKQIADKLNGLAQKDQDDIIFMLQQLFDLANAIDFSHVSKLKEFLESFFGQFSNISSSDRQEWMELIVKLVVPRIASIEKLTDEDILAKFKDKYPAVMDSMDKPAKEFLHSMLIKYIKLLLTSQKRELQFFKEKMMGFLQSPEELKAFMEKLEKIGDQNKSSKGIAQLNLVLKQLSDFFLKSEQYGHIFKIILQLSKSSESLSKEQISNFQQEVKDFEIKSPQVGHLLKTLAKVDEMNVSDTIKEVHSVIKSLIDNASVEIKLKSFLVKMNDKLGEMTSETKTKIKEMIQQFKDSFINIEIFRKFITALQFLQKNNLLGVSSQKVNMLTKQMEDFEIKFPQIGFLIKTLFDVSGTPSAKEMERVQMAIQRIVDNDIEVDKSFKFLMKSFTEAYNAQSSEKNSKIKAIMTKLRDYFIKTEPFNKFVLSIQALQKGLVGHFLKSKFSAALKAIQDFEIQFPQISFLIKTVNEIEGNPSNAQLKNLNMALTRIKDNKVEVDVQFKFLLKTLSEALMGEASLKQQKVKQVLVKMRDYFIKTEPFNKFLIGLQTVLNGSMQTQMVKKVGNFSKIVQDFEIKMPEMAFLISSVYQVSTDLSTYQVQKIGLALQMISDNKIEVENPIKFLMKNFLELVGFEGMVELKKIRLILRGIKDEKIEITPFAFLMGTLASISGGLSVYEQKMIKVVNRRVRDYEIMIQLMGFLMSGLKQISEINGFKETKLFRNSLQVIKDNFIEVQTPKVLYKFLVEIQKKVSMKKTTVLKAVLQGLRDYLILHSDFAFVVKNDYLVENPTLAHKLHKFIGFWKLFKDYLVTPEPLESFVISDVLFRKNTDQMKKMLKFKMVRKILKDNYIFVNAQFKNFLIRNLIKFFKPFKFASVAKFRMVLRKFVDAFIIPQNQKQFLIKAIMSLYRPSISNTITFQANFVTRKIIDNMIQVNRNETFLEKGWLRNDKRVSIKKLMQLQSYWRKMRDYLVSPLSLEQFILMSIIMPSKNYTQARLDQMKMLLTKAQDYPNLIDPKFGKFLLKSMYVFFKEFKVANIAKLKFMLRKFVDAFIITDPEKKFLIKALLTQITRSPFQKQKLKFNTFFRKVKDHLIQIMGHNFLLKSQADVKYSFVSQKLLKLKAFWSKLQDFLNTPDPLNKFLLKSLFLKTSTDRVKLSLKNSFMLKQLKDYMNIVSPDFRIFLLRSIFQLSKNFKFYSKTKLHIFLRKIVDAFNLPDNQSKFLLKMLFDQSKLHLSSKGKFMFKSAFKKILDKFVPIERNEIFLENSKIALRFPEKESELKQVSIYLRRFKDFFISPLSIDQFILSSLFSSPNVYNKKQIESFKALLQKYNDLPIFLSLDFRKFFLSSLFRIFKTLKFNSVVKLKFALRRFVDHFIFPHNVRQFLLKYSLSLLRKNFISQSTLNMKLLTRVLHDYKIDITVPGIFLEKSRMGIANLYLKKSLLKFETFLRKVNDYLVSPIRLDLFLIRLAAKGRADFVIKNFASFRAKFAKIKDFMIYPEKYLAFLLRYVQKMSHNIHFKSLKKMKIFLRKSLDQFIQPEDLKKFLIRMIVQNLDGGLTVHGKLRFNMIFSHFLDKYITIYGKDFLLKNRFYLRAKKAGLKLYKFKILLRQIKDFFISPDTLGKYLLKAIMKQSSSLAALKKLYPKLFLRKVTDYPNLTNPQGIIFLMMSLAKMFPQFRIISKTQIKFMFRHFLDAFVIPHIEADFLIKMLGRFYKKNYVKKTIHMKTFLYKFVDQYIAMQPNTFFIRMFQKNSQYSRAITKFNMKARLAAIRDQKIEINNMMTFFLFSFLKNRKRNAMKYFKKVKGIWRKTKDEFITMRNRDFLLKMLSYNIHQKQFRQIFQVKMFLKKFRDYHILTYRLNTFLLKMFLTYFGDFHFINRTKFKMFWKRFMDNFVDVFHRNLMNFFYKQYSSPKLLRHGTFQIDKILKKFKMGFNFRYIRDINFSQKTLAKRKEIQYRQQNFQGLFQKRKMRFNRRHIRDINAIIKQIQHSHKSVSKENKGRISASRRKMHFLKNPIRGINLGLKKFLHHAVINKLDLSNKAAYARRKMHFLRRAIRDVNMSQIITDKKVDATALEKKIRMRMYRMRLNFIKNRFGWSMMDQGEKQVPSQILEQNKFTKVFSRRNIKVYYRYWAREIKRLKKESQISMKEDTIGYLRLGKSKLKIRLHSDMMSMKGNKTKGKTMTTKKTQADQVGKIKFKPFYPERIQKAESKNDLVRAFYKRMKSLNSDLSKIKIKVLNYVTGEGFKQKKGLNSIRNRLKELDTNFDRIILKPLEFVNFPKMTKNYSQTFHKNAIGMSLSSFQKKLSSIQKIFLRRVGIKKKKGSSHSVNTKMTRHIKKVYKLLKKVKNYPTIKKIVLNEDGWKSGNKITDSQTKIMKSAFAKIKKMLANQNYQSNYSGLEKLMLDDKGTNPGNKITDIQTKTLKLVGLSKRKFRQQHKAFGSLLNSAKVLLEDSRKSGNKMTDKNTIVKKFVGDIFKQYYGLTKNKIDFEGFKKIYLKFNKLLSAPVYYKSAFHLIENLRKSKAYDQGFSTFKKVILSEDFGSGNKMTDKDPRVYTLKAQKAVLHAFKSIDNQLESSKKILIKSLDLPSGKECECPECCCEFLVFHSTGEESEEEEAEEAGEMFKEGTIIDPKREISFEKEKETLRSIARGDPEDVASISEKKVWQILGLDPSDEYAQGWSDLESPGHVYLQHQAEELLENLDDSDLDCSNKKHKVFNILPDVHFDMTVKNVEKTRQGWELTTTKDIPELSQVHKGTSDNLLERFNSEFENDKNPSLEPPKWMKDNGRIIYKSPILEGSTKKEVELMRDSKDYSPDFHEYMEKGENFMGKDFHEEHHYSKLATPEQQIGISTDDTIDML